MQRQITARLTRINFTQKQPKVFQQYLDFCLPFFFSGLKESFAHGHIYSLISLVMLLNWQHKDSALPIFMLLACLGIVKSHQRFFHPELCFPSSFFKFFYFLAFVCFCCFFQLREKVQLVADLDLISL